MPPEHEVGAKTLAARRREFDALAHQARERLIAVHEAGHAVVHYYHQHFFDRMVLNEEGGLVEVGRVAFVADAFFDSVAADPLLTANLRRGNDYRVTAVVDALIAGSVAECRLMGWSPLHIVPGDERVIDGVLRHVYGTQRFQEMARQRKRAASRRVHGLFRRRGVWASVLKLADRLLTEREIDGEDAFSFLRERSVPNTGLRDYMKALRRAEPAFVPERRLGG